MEIELKREVDLQTLMRWRREVICHVFSAPPDDALMEANRRYYERHIADGTHIAFVAEANGGECGCGGICLGDELPSPDNPSGRCAYLMNIYVREAFRKHGVAHAVVRRLISEARSRGCGKIYLESTQEGRGLYLSTGFRDMPDMMKYYEDED